MFAKYYLELPYPVEAVRGALLQEAPESWLPGLVQAGGEWEDRLLADVGFSVGSARVDRRVEIKIGDPAPLGAGLVLPLSWRAASQESLFPLMEADLEIAPLGPGFTQISVNARYTPPLALVGRLLDRTLLHRVAEAVIRDFTERVGDQLRSRLDLGAEQASRSA
jgi:hypothetical protein